MKISGPFFFHATCSNFSDFLKTVLIRTENILNFYNINSRQYLLVQYQQQPCNNMSFTGEVLRALEGG